MMEGGKILRDNNSYVFGLSLIGLFRRRVPLLA